MAARQWGCCVPNNWSPSALAVCAEILPLRYILSHLTVPFTGRGQLKGGVRKAQSETASIRGMDPQKVGGGVVEPGTSIDFRSRGGVTYRTAGWSNSEPLRDAKSFEGLVSLSQIPTHRMPNVRA
jgi:hypothetical protein